MMGGVGAWWLQILLVAADVYRPAAIDQLVTLGSRISVDVFTLGSDADPVVIAKQAIAKAKQEQYTTVRRPPPYLLPHSHPPPASQPASSKGGGGAD